LCDPNSNEEMEGSIVKIVMKYLKFNISFKRQDENADGAQLITLNTKRNTCFQYLRERKS
jgi:hypothetical protein